ncbi:MAG: glycerophosphodiester phosphodiesterase family protein [Novosphingobium sp.]
MRLLLSALDPVLAPAPAPDRVAWLKRGLFAHRGLHGNGSAENSLAAFAAAIERGFGIECDVQRSGDGQAMVFHDWDLDRLTGESGAVMDRTARRLAAIPLTGSTDTIPSLRRVLDLVAGRVPLLIEVKSKREHRVAGLCLAVRRALEGYRGQHAVMSFDPRVGRWFAEHSPFTVRGLVVTEENARTLSGNLRRHLALWHARPDFLAYDVRDFPSKFAASQRARGIPVTSWTVRSPELRAKAAEHADAPIAEGAGIP